MECLLACGVILAISIAFMMAQQSAIRKAEEAYQRALNDLRQNPHAEHAHQAALSRGRELATLTRSKTGPVLYDEARIANDIRAVTANATKTVPAPVAPMTPPVSAPKLESGPSAQQRLEKLTELLERGLLTQEEFDIKRQQIIDSL